MHLRCQVLAALALVLAGPSTANAASTTDLGAAISVLGTTDGRWAAWVPRQGKVTVFDARTRARRTFADPAGCRPTAVGDRTLLYTCPSLTPYLDVPRLRDVSTGVVSRPAVDVSGLPARGTTSLSWVGVGAQWLGATAYGAKSQVTRFFPRAGGEPFTGRAFGPRSQPDLDASRLARTVCSPLQLTRDGNQDTETTTDGFIPLQFAGQYALDTGPLVVPAGGAPPRTILRHCGSTRERIICPSDCGTPTLYHGQVLWVARFKLRARSFTATRSRAIRVPGHEIDKLWLLGNRVLLAADGPSVPAAPSADQPFRLLLVTPPIAPTMVHGSSPRRPQ